MKCFFLLVFFAAVMSLFALSTAELMALDTLNLAADGLTALAGEAARHAKVLREQLQSHQQRVLHQKKQAQASRSRRGQAGALQRALKLDLSAPANGQFPDFPPAAAAMSKISTLPNPFAAIPVESPAFFKKFWPDFCSSFCMKPPGGGLLGGLQNPSALGFLDQLPLTSLLAVESHSEEVQASPSETKFYQAKTPKDCGKTKNPNIPKLSNWLPKPKFWKGFWGKWCGNFCLPSSPNFLLPSFKTPGLELPKMPGFGLPPFPKWPPALPTLPGLPPLPPLPGLPMLGTLPLPGALPSLPGLPLGLAFNAAMPNLNMQLGANINLNFKLGAGSLAFGTGAFGLSFDGKTIGRAAGGGGAGAGAGGGAPPDGPFYQIEPYIDPRTKTV
eukprot:gnl/Spiro4/18227_TR9738_c0_g1_i1.p1 gnl/Spiro4/18227_TR9738_c0_g1~~gnl/Spiro4/18227_TR9738_c0_g1_i1.p1  ORF type:complete len:426 (-),score=87.01 gnl/Spiro4/18227_TR9738_c0_g1_i1:30-1190(-)